MDPRVKKLSEVIVQYSVGIKKDDLVVIQGPPSSEPLIVALCETIIKAGGHPHVRMSPDVLTELMLKHGSEDQLKYVSPLAMHDIETADVRIALWAEVNTKALSNCDPERQGMLSAAKKPIFTRFFERTAAGELRWCGTLFPTQASAQDAGMSLLEYEDFVYNAGLLDQEDPVALWKQVDAKQQKLIELIADKKTIHVEADNGTDLKMSVEGRKWINCCGKENFPDGEVFTSPVEDSLEGTIAFSFPACHMGHECRGVKLRFEKGKVVEATAESGEEFLQGMLKQDEGASIAGEFAFGTNYGVQQFTKNTLFDEKIGGTVHLAVGAAFPEAGGKNQSGLHWDMVCDLRGGGRVTMDGQTIFENGKCKVMDF